MDLGKDDIFISEGPDSTMLMSTADFLYWPIEPEKAREMGIKDLKHPCFVWDIRTDR